VYPKISELESSLFTFLSSQSAINTSATVTSTHPRDKSELSGGKGRIVLTFVNDIAEGRYITRAISEPALQFACYTLSYPRSRGLQEAVIATMETWNGVINSTTKVGSFYKNTTFGPAYEASSDTFVAAVVYRYFLVKYA
jgi:hypothetical protein